VAKPRDHGTFAKDGVVMVAHTPEDEVRMRFDGWTDVAAEEARRAAAEEQPADDTDAKPKKTNK
jgi:hypothetical protein